MQKYLETAIGWTIILVGVYLVLSTRNSGSALTGIGNFITNSTLTLQGRGSRSGGSTYNTGNGPRVAIDNGSMSLDIPGWNTSPPILA